MRSLFAVFIFRSAALARAIMTIAPAAIPRTHVTMTVTGGKIVWRE